MNCATHNDVEAVAYCRTCGKALCPKCAHGVRGVIYCEDCLAARLEGVQPAQTPYQQVMDQGLGLKVAPGPTSGPNPTVAGILAGFFPVGVGAVYNGQYAKGLAHLLIAFGLVWGQASTDSDGMHVLLAFTLGFYYFYQIFDAVRSAKAIQAGQPAPDPFGLAKTFSAADSVDASKIPVAALVLIGLGVLFLLHNLGFWFLSFGRIWPIFLIAIGGWLFARRWGLLGHGEAYDCERCRARGMMGPAVLVTLGTMFLLHQLSIFSFGRTLPGLLIVIGAVLIFQRSASDAGHRTLPPPGTGYGAPVSDPAQTPSSEVKHG